MLKNFEGDEVIMITVTNQIIKNYLHYPKKKKEKKLRTRESGICA